MRIFTKLMGKSFCDPVSHLQTRGDSYKEFSESCEVFVLFKLVARLKDKTAGNGVVEHCAFTICKRVCNYVVYLLPAYKTTRKNILYTEKAIKITCQQSQSIQIKKKNKKLMDSQG